VANFILDRYTDQTYLFLITLYSKISDFQGMHYLFHALDLINESDESIFDRGRFDKLMVRVSIHC
jgi:hypothetical protein